MPAETCLQWVLGVQNTAVRAVVFWDFVCLGLLGFAFIISTSYSVERFRSDPALLPALALPCWKAPARQSSA